MKTPKLLSLYALALALAFLLAACAVNASPSPGALPTTQAVTLAETPTDTEVAVSPTASVTPTPTITPTSTPTLPPTPYPVERLVFVEMNNPEGYDPFIALINSDGSGYEKLDFTVGYLHDSDMAPENGTYLAVSPNGRYLAFNGYNETYPSAVSEAFGTNYGVVIADLQARTIVTLTDAVNGGFSWSPDSTQLVLSDVVELPDEQGLFHGKANLFVLNIETNEKRQLLENFSDDREPAWSPDGQWIAFLRSVPDVPCLEADCENSLHIIHPDGSGLTRLVENIFHNFYSGIAPVWSPDSQWLAVLSKTRNPILVKVSSGEERYLSFDVWQTPRWFPDNNRLLLCSGERNATDIYSFEWDDGQPLNLSNHPAYDGFPLASPSGNWVAFRSGREAESLYPFHRLYVMRSDGSGIRYLERLALRFAWLPTTP